MRISPYLAVVVTACGLLLVTSSSQEKSGAEDDADTKPKVRFSPEVEKQFSNFIDQVAEAKRKIWAEEAQKEIGGISRITGLKRDGDEAKALESAAERATDLCIPGWKAEMDRMWRRNYAASGDETIPQMLEQATSMADEYARYNSFDHVRPTEHPSWQEALRQTLSPEQFASWEKDRTDRKDALQKKIAEFLKPQLGRMDESYRRPYLSLGAELSRGLSLSKELSKQLEGLAESVAKTGVANWRKQAERMLLSYDEIQRRQVFKQGTFYISLDERQMAKLRAAWKEGLEKILPSEVKQRLQTLRAEQRVRQIHAWSQLLIAELDRRVAFTASQRDRLPTFVEQLLTNTPGLTSDESDIADTGIPLNALYVAAEKANETEIKRILDDVQWKRWKEACKNKGNDLVAPRMVIRTLTSRQDEEKETLPPSEPEEIEAVLSDYLASKAAAERSRTLNSMILKAEDAARVTSLSASAVDRLQTAARGATERSLDQWRAGLYELVRPYANGGTVQLVTQRLANVQDYRLQRLATSPEQQAIWEQTVKAVLSPEQQEAWKTEIRQRNSYRDSAMAAGLLEAFARKVQLDQSQAEKLQPKLAAVLTEYGEDIRSMFSSSTSWYLQRYSMFLPFAAVPENEMKEFLTKEQWDAWTGCNEFSNATNYWENVKRMHDQRAKITK